MFHIYVVESFFIAKFVYSINSNRGMGCLQKQCAFVENYVFCCLTGQLESMIQWYGLTYTRTLFCLLDFHFELLIIPHLFVTKWNLRIGSVHLFVCASAFASVSDLCQHSQHHLYFLFVMLLNLLTGSLRGRFVDLATVCDTRFFNKWLSCLVTYFFTWPL